jgi:hypothetical protein
MSLFGLELLFGTKTPDQISIELYPQAGALALDPALAETVRQVRRCHATSARP